jgi:O-6-methylguanine DNA methyltransferase
MKNIPGTIKEKMKSYSAFEQMVWTACAKIPAGQTRTYGWIAEQIGRPGAGRAVGTALGRNPFAPTIPCHRVLRSDGKMGGYSGRGGIKTKIKLLQKEGAKI